MKTFLATVFLVVLTALTAVAQQSAVKIGFMNTDAFLDEKAGIGRLIAANKQIDVEFGAKIKALQDGNTKLEALADELQKMQKLPVAQFKQATFNAKRAEGEKLQRELNYKKSELETEVGKARERSIGPVMKDIGNAVDEFAKKNGYTIIFNIAKLDDAGAILYLGEAGDVTKEFIAYFNGRPATAKP